MQLSLTKVERCEKLLTSSIALAAANAGPRSSIYNRPQNRFSEFNETIWECHDNYYLDAATLSHLLQFGTVIRRGEGRLVSLAAGIFLPTAATAFSSYTTSDCNHSTKLLLVSKILFLTTFR